VFNIVNKYQNRSIDHDTYYDKIVHEIVRGYSADDISLENQPIFAIIDNQGKIVRRDDNMEEIEGVKNSCFLNLSARSLAHFSDQIFGL